ncbi:MAG: alpha/beta hydrolase [Gammaproteobacteria bacterium]|nr:alpha/beta hydrolase [Gammaproteobacteria bacterium]MDH5172233.1 alpha/beta hydrolase [Gammaproteobacteria bacterium]
MTEFLALPDGSRIAYEHLPGATPGILFCPGFNSNMQGVKALALEQWCGQQGRQFTRFDYFGHGESDGSVEQGCIGRWLDDALAILDNVTSGPQLVVGSSMGGWIMLLLALARPGRIHSLLGLAAAPDFTDRLRGRLTPEQRDQLIATGYTDLPNCYDDGEPYRIGRQLLEEGDSHLLLGREIPVEVPVRLIQGQRDDDVPWQLALELAANISSPDIEVQLVKDGDHRLSQPADLQRLRVAAGQLLCR